MKVTVKQLWVFPVKALRGIAVESAELTPLGLRYDRHWMIVKADGGFITQRQQPSMVLVTTRLTADALILHKQGMEELTIPLAYPQSCGEPFAAKIWQDICPVVDEGKDASRWLTEAIGYREPVRLVRMQRDRLRPQSKPELLGERTHTLFADAAPYLICHQASLKALNTAMTSSGFEPVPMERFRPNIVVSGLAAFYEHQVQTLDHQAYSLTQCYPCKRCIVPTVDIATGRRHPRQQPFSLLAQLNAMPDNPKAPAFGENTILTRCGWQWIQVGDELSVC